MKIAVIENNIIATNTIRKKLMEVLQLQGHTVLILTTGNKPDLQRARENNFDIIDVGVSMQNPLSIFRYMRNLHATLKKFQPDVCLTFTIRPAIWGNLITRKLTIPTITNITGIGPLFEHKGIAYTVARLLYRFALKKTKHIFFQNDDDRRLFLQKKFAPVERTEKIPGSGIDYNYYHPMPSAEKRFVFLFLSRLIKDKGILEYVEAARTLRSELPGVVFRIVGPMWDQNLKTNTVTATELEQWQKEGIIEYGGEVADVRSVIADCSCLVLPSYREGTSNVLLEASSMEKPCITCNTTGCREIIEHGKTGFLCKVQDADDLASTMKLLFSLTKDERLQMGKAARQKVIKEFDKQIVITAYLNAIERVHN